MKILYRQPEPGEELGALERLGVRRLYVKALSSDRDQKNVVRREHHHTGFEIHLVTDGEEWYQAEGKMHRIGAGHYLVLPPGLPHRALVSGKSSQKYSLTFHAREKDGLFFSISGHCIQGSMTQSMGQCLQRIQEEAEQCDPLSNLLQATQVAELIVLICRAAGYREPTDACQQCGEDPRLAIARQYIRDNAAFPLSCGEVAAYCHLSTRQLNRLFKRAEGVSVAQMIYRERGALIEQMLVEGRLTLRQISETIGFSSEYYLNAFVKKHTGMTPGAYRRMHRQSESDEPGVSMVLHQNDSN